MNERDLVRCAIYNARRMAKAEFKKKPNWVLAMELWSVGSTMAWQMCREAGLDPDASVTERPWRARATVTESVIANGWVNPRGEVDQTGRPVAARPLTDLEMVTSPEVSPVDRMLAHGRLAWLNRD